MSRPARPKPIAAGPIRGRVARGPREEDGRFYWRASVHEDGKESPRWSGWATREEAEVAIASIVASGKAQVARAAAERTDTVRDLCEIYLARQRARADLSPRTPDAIRVMLRHVVRVIGEVKLERLDGDTLDRYRDTRLREGGAPQTIVGEMKRIRAAWVWGISVGLTPPRGLPRVATPKIERRNNGVTPERGDILDVLARVSAWSRLAIYLLAATGCRIGEVADLRWSAVDLRRAELQVRGKTGARMVPLAPPAVRILQAWLDEHPPSSPSDRIWPVARATVRSSTYAILARACDAAGIPRFTAQGLRRAAVDALYRSGADVATAAAVAGHSPRVALEHYRRATAADTRNSVKLARLGYLDEPAEVIHLGDRRK